MSLESKVFQLQENLKILRHDYQSEIDKMIDSPKCYLAQNMKLSETEKKCLGGA